MIGPVTDGEQRRFLRCRKRHVQQRLLPSVLRGEKRGRGEGGRAKRWLKMEPGLRSRGCAVGSTAPGLGTFCMEFGCSPCACMGSVWVLWLPPTVNKQEIGLS
ncbi:hypothetical protein ATANTOWER_010242 [Ataeniobius toweri]|uniref:Uncharacterized protein n=1 Tax=Ataeniobius toweri TaxID=208326 RepID=A0ABU7A5V9_9TELE|nr:hypothetical protein [Ataeniobius toweri]